MPRRFTAWLPLSALALLAAAVLPQQHARAGPGDDWTRFRGPNGSGVSASSVPAAFSEKDCDWKIEIPGVGHSSPAVWGDHVLVTAADEDTGKRLLVCVNAADGEVV